MFDGLKDKLSSFTSDVEEDVDEEAVDEDAGEDELADAEPTPEADDSDAGEPADAVSETAETPAAGTADGTAADESAETTDDEPSDDAEGDTAAVGIGGADTASSTDESDAASETADSDDSDAVGETDDADDDGGRSLTEKAKIMATGKTVIEEDDLQDHLDDLELALLSSDVEMGVANEILQGVKANLTGQTRRRLSSTGNMVQDAVREALYDVISVGQFDFDERVAAADKPVVIVFTGVNGVGKTTTIAKLAQYFEDRGLSTVLANGDTYRAGANEQLQQHAQNLDKKVIAHEQGSDPTAVIYDAVEYANANDIDVVLGDTAGRLHTSDDLMAQLEKIDRNIDPDMTLFVDEAVAGQDAVNRAREFNDAAEVDGAVLTKADADPQGGAAISIAHVTGKPILFLGTGQDYDDLEQFDPEEIVDQLLGE
ncbi:signal recognition particle-docking protein FtsY [Halomicroarcula sp. GCM10025709]|uniref:signal recognition particle-docking protein FtsY n=1 Tax=Haloarcula TaxID=2237 RepID=UPI0024C41F50|nr:signal recognition particle-docking protein FtsY [Halomicroarcula sp. YJ-61-S]